MTPEHELQAARDHAWRELGRAPIRRALLGRERSDALVRVAIDKLPTADLAAAGDNADIIAIIRSRTEQRVLDAYSEQCGFAFLTFVVLWAISAIVQVLVVRWWTAHHSEPQP